MLTICIDFDGVIHSYTSGWKGIDVISDPPVDHAIYALQVYTGYFDVCIYSSRSQEQKGIDAMIKWLLDNGLEPQYLSKIRFPIQKPAAFLTIDDRAICFVGHFPMPKEIKAFKPWNKKEISIKCPKCGIVSYNQNDVANKYCGNCHKFHDENL